MSPPNSLAVAALAGCSLRYDIHGPVGAPVLVMSHSLGANLHMWDSQLETFATRWRVVRYDTRGHGGSSVPAGPYTIEQLGTDVTQLLDYLDVERAHFCGLSMGGLTALYLAAAYPERLLRVAVCSSAPRLGSTLMWDERIAVVRARGMQPVAATVGQRWFTAAFGARDPNVVASIEQQVRDTPVDGYAACCGALRDTDLRPSVPEMRRRVLVLAGAHDPAVPTADARWLAEHLPDAAYTELPTAHLSNVENPAAFNERLSQFLTA